MWYCLFDLERKESRIRTRGILKVHLSPDRRLYGLYIFSCYPAIAFLLLGDYILEQIIQ